MAASYPVSTTTVTSKGAAINATEFDANMTGLTEAANDLNTRVAGIEDGTTSVPAADLATNATTAANATQAGGATPSTTSAAGGIPIADDDGHISIGWLPLAVNLEALGAVGFRWDPRNDTYQIFNQSSLTAVHLGMKRCVMDNTGTKVYNLGASDSTKQEDGTTAATIDGTNGQVMVEIPKCYTGVWTDDYGYVNVWASDIPLPGLSLHPAFDFGGDIQSYRYVGAFEACLYQSTKYGSCYPAASTAPANNLTRTQFRTNMADGVFGQWDYHLVDLIRILAYTEYGTFRVQEQLEGHTEDSSAEANLTAVGDTLSLGNASGTINNGTLNTSMSYRGIENLFGNIWTWVDGINVYDWVPYICDDPANIAALGSTPPANYHQILDQHGNAIEFPHSNNYQKYLWDGTLLPSSIGGGSSSYISDYFYQASGARVVGFGGTLNYERAAGPGYWNASNSASGTYWYIGSRSAIIA